MTRHPRFHLWHCAHIARNVTPNTVTSHIGATIKPCPPVGCHRIDCILPCQPLNFGHSYHCNPYRRCVCMPSLLRPPPPLQLLPCLVTILPLLLLLPCRLQPDYSARHNRPPDAASSPHATPPQAHSVHLARRASKTSPSDRGATDQGDHDSVPATPGRGCWARTLTPACCGGGIDGGCVQRRFRQHRPGMAAGEGGGSSTDRLSLRLQSTVQTLILRRIIRLNALALNY
jgi:hypothetical protein